MSALDLEFIRIREKNYSVYYSLEEKYEKVPNTETEATELSKQVYDIVMKRLKKHFTVDKNSLRLLIADRQHENYECFVWHGEGYKEMRYYEPTFTTKERKIVEEFKKECIELVKSTLNI